MTIADLHSVAFQVRQIWISSKRSEIKRKALDEKGSLQINEVVDPSSFGFS